MRQPPQFGDKVEVVLLGEAVSLDYARYWIEQIGLSTGDEITADTRVVICAGGYQPEPDSRELLVRIHVWDFQVDIPGTGAQASAVSGVSWVLGHADRPPLILPADIPEKWCGMFAATLAMTSLIEIELSGTRIAREFDVSTADVLRAFADQNAGNHAEVEAGWRRNGSLAVEHGGIYPQGFFECADGYVAIVGRARKDWKAIREVIGWPEWAGEERFDDPFAIAQDSSEVDALLTTALKGFSRDELLQRALSTGATVAPVYTLSEISTRQIVRPDYFDADGMPRIPFRISRSG
jgi:crotonobetainyl-CoA:carnitine CoA-transferase CaiB-like acyl-CoA transferase